MEGFVYISEKNPNNTTIIGTDNQGLQAIIPPGLKGIFIKYDLLAYHSENLSKIHYSELESDEYLKEIAKTNFIQTNLDSLAFKCEKSKSNDFVYFYNKTNEIQYLGLGYTGKIMKINVELTGHLYINHRFIIAFDDIVDLFKFPKLDEFLLDFFVPSGKMSYFINDYSNRKAIMNENFTFYYPHYKQLNPLTNLKNPWFLDNNVYLQSESMN